MTYTELLKTREWRECRQRVIDMAGAKCDDCGRYRIKSDFCTSRKTCFSKRSLATAIRITGTRTTSTRKSCPENYTGVIASRNLLLSKENNHAAYV